MILILALLQVTPSETAFQKLTAKVPELIKASDKDADGALNAVEFRVFAVAAENAGKALLAESLPPLVAGPHRHAHGDSLVATPSFRSYVIDDRRSTIGAGSGITVDVHLGLLLAPSRA